MTRARPRYKRGYPLAVLIGLEDRRAVLWRVFSGVVKFDGAVEREEKSERRGLYDFHESIVKALRSPLKEGVKSILVAAPARTDYRRDLINHIQKHHAWLLREGPNCATLGELTGSASQLHDVHELVRTKAFRDVLGEARSRDADNIVAALEKGLDSDRSDTVVYYSLDEIEDLVYGKEEQGKPRPEYVVLTDRCVADAKNRGRILRLLQISKNTGVKTTIVNVDTQAGFRLSQLGGLVCLARPNRERRR